VNGSTNCSWLSGPILLNQRLFGNCSQVFRFIICWTPSQLREIHVALSQPWSIL
jgi:hypothetical protein